MYRLDHPPVHLQDPFLTENDPSFHHEDDELGVVLHLRHKDHILEEQRLQHLVLHMQSSNLFLYKNNRKYPIKAPNYSLKPILLYRHDGHTQLSIQHDAAHMYYISNSCFLHHGRINNLTCQFLAC